MPWPAGSARCSATPTSASRSSASARSTSAARRCLLADARDDRAGFPLLHELAAEVRALPGRPSTEGLLQPVGEHFIPAPYAEELLA